MTKLKTDRQKRVDWEKEEEIKKREEKELRMKKEFERRMNPKSKEDFDLLYAALESKRSFQCNVSTVSQPWPKVGSILAM